MADFEVAPLEHSPWPTPSRAIYGFVLYVASYVLFGVYIIWAIFPDSWLNSVGITYLPARHWIITFPFLMWFAVVVLVVVYSTMYLTAVDRVDAISTVRDCYSKVLVSEENIPSRIPPIADMQVRNIEHLLKRPPGTRRTNHKNVLL